jgi:hypothetical protein
LGQNLGHDWLNDSFCDDAGIAGVDYADISWQSRRQ